MPRYRNILITGGAGFVGSNLAFWLKRHAPDTYITAADNLRRRGSETNVARLRAAGINFLHCDIRNREDLRLGTQKSDEWPIDLLIDCSAEPSVQAGLDGSPRYVLETNLAGSINCLELARARGAAFLFLSTSRIYPIAPLNALPYDEEETRSPLARRAGGAGVLRARDRRRVPARRRPLVLRGQQARLRAADPGVRLQLWPAGMINRCGVLAGPWQMGKVDQGVIALWVARHFFGRR